MSGEASRRLSEPKKTPDLDDPDAAKLRVALCQIATREWDVAGNLARTEAALEEAAALEADLAITAECVLHGYPNACRGFMKRLVEAAEPLDGPSLERLRGRAASLRLSVAIGFAEAGEAGRFHNSLAVFGPDGSLRQHYRKVHLRDFEDAGRGGCFVAGDKFFSSPVTGRSATANVGGMICFDREVPEAMRCLRSLGAELIVCPLACDTSDASHPRDFVDNEVITRVRATENEVFVAVVNHADRFNGGSYVVGPGGEVLHQMGAGPGVAVVDVPVGIVRDRLHADPDGWMGWGFRRPEVYLGYLRG